MESNQTSIAPAVEQGCRVRLPRWKPMDVVYLGNLRQPRGLVLEVYEWEPGDWRYTVFSESEGDHHGEHQDWVMSQKDWLRWFEGFADELTGKEMRDLRAAALAPFVEPASWAGFRQRYADTGDPWLPYPKLPNKQALPQGGK